MFPQQRPGARLVPLPYRVHHTRMRLDMNPGSDRSSSLGPRVLVPAHAGPPGDLIRKSGAGS